MTKINKKQNEKKIINLFGKSYGIICNPRTLRAIRVANLRHP